MPKDLQSLNKAWVEPVASSSTSVVEPPKTISQFLEHYKRSGWNEEAESLDISDFIRYAIDVSGKPHKKKAFWFIAYLMGLREPSFFPKLKNRVVAYELVLRVLRPRLIDQQQFGFCGPAAFGCLLAQTNPCDYVRMAYDLLKGGCTHIAGLEIKPRRQIREYDPKGNMGQADWLIMASLRNCSKRLSQDMETTGVYGNTQVWRMFEWLKKAGYGTIVSIETAEDDWFSKKTRYRSQHYHPRKPDVLKTMTSDDFSNSRKNLRLAKKFLDHDWKVFLLVSEKLAQSTGATDPIEGVMAAWRNIEEDEAKLAKLETKQVVGEIGKTSNHWAMVTNIEITEQKKIRLTRFSYGTLKTTAPIPEKYFGKVYGGFVAINETDMEEAFKNWSKGPREATVVPHGRAGKAEKS